MDHAELGKRLKAARLARKMTQSDVVGDFITRNMLSQIESGTAIPSMKTLEYLAGVLEIPLDQLFADPETQEEHSGIQLLQEAKDLLRNGCYEAVLALEDKTDQLSDELHAIQSMASMALANTLAEYKDAEHLQNAVVYARHAAREAEIGLYANADRVAQANHLIAQLAKYLSTYYSHLATGETEG